MSETNLKENAMRESAFPIPLDDRLGSYPAEPGMTLRDYFAAKAMQALIARIPYGEAAISQAAISTAAYNFANAMVIASKED